MSAPQNSEPIKAYQSIHTMLSDLSSLVDDQSMTAEFYADTQKGQLHFMQSHKTWYLSCAFNPADCKKTVGNIRVFTRIPDREM